MYSIIIALLIGGGVGYFTGQDLGVAWGTVCGVATVMVFQLLLGLWIRRKVTAINLKIQHQMEVAQAKINRKVQLFQQRGGGNVKQMQQSLEREQSAAVREAIATTSEAEKYYKWNMLLKKQINTMRMMLHFQIREFSKVDELMPSCMFMDPRSVAIKIVRMFKNSSGDIGKFYAKKSKRLKGEDCAFLASLYAWIQIKQGDNSGALATLVAAKERSDNEVLIANWERLVNGKVKHFSNAGFGDLWYSMYLEEPKVKQQRAQQPRF